MIRAPRTGGRESARAAVAALALLTASAASAGCGLGEGERSEGEATITVTRDYGAEELLDATTEDPPASETAMRMLEREADIETRYGGGFVQSIDGLSGGTDDGRRSDWFFYVNGDDAGVGAAEVDVKAGDRIWWDLHDWTDVMRVPAVVGSFPAPFATEGGEVSCTEPAGACDDVEAALADAAGEGEGEEPVEVLAGTWEQIRDEPAADLLAGAPARSGVFARFEEGADATELVLYDETLAERERLGPGAGLVAAVEGPDGAPVWLVTGTDSDGVSAAAELLDEDSLTSHFAVATTAEGDPVPIPVAGP